MRKRALGLLALVAVQLAAVPARSHAPSGDVLGVSVVSAPGRAEVVVDVRGQVGVTDFVLQNPARLVLDLTGARLVGPALAYDGVNRAGIRDVRYSQFRSDVVRVVIELDEARDYRVAQESSAVRVAFETAQSFAAWPRGAAAPSGPAAAPAAALPAAIPPAAALAPSRAEERVSAQAPQAVQQRRISVTWDAAPMSWVIAQFAEFSGRSIVQGTGVEGTVSAEIKNQPWDVAFYAILNAHRLAATELHGGILRVESRTNIAVADSVSEPTVARSVRINYSRASNLVPAVTPILSRRGTVVADSVTNSLIVREVESRMDSVIAFIRRELDQRTMQVAISAKIIFVNRTDLEALGLRYDLGTNSTYFSGLIPRDTSGARTPPTTTASAQSPQVILGGNALAAIGNAGGSLTKSSLDIIFSTVFGRYALSAFLQAAQTASLADVQAEPQLTVVDNQNASIFVGQRTPVRMQEQGAAAGGGAGRVTVSFQETGIKLTVTPHIVRGTREILMELRAERSSIEQAPTADVGGIFNQQVGETRIIVRDGETAVIGGLTVTEVSVARSGIPFLMDLPVVGRLFGTRSTEEKRQDLLILVTPRIVDDIVPSEAPQR